MSSLFVVFDVVHRSSFPTALLSDTFPTLSNRYNKVIGDSFRHHCYRSMKRGHGKWLLCRLGRSWTEDIFMVWSLDAVRHYLSAGRGTNT